MKIILIILIISIFLLMMILDANISNNESRTDNRAIRRSKK